MRLKRRELNNLIESFLFEEEEADTGDTKTLTKLEDTPYGKAAKQVFLIPGGEVVTYIFPDLKGNSPDPYETPDGGKYYYGTGDEMKEALVVTKGNETFIYHPENKPKGIE